ncbi:MAG: carbon-nitrogen hydrolase [Candidatus Micrarchaeota archaeon]
MKIALIQMSMTDNQDENLSKALQFIKEASEKGAKIICLPELFTSTYFPQEENVNTEKFTESIPGKSHDLLSKAAKDNQVVIIGGSIFEKADKLYNTSMVFDENGKLLGNYRKIHIPYDEKFYEKNYFEKGDLGYKVFETKYGRIAVLICYDQWFPEAARIVSLMGADMIFYPTAIGICDSIKQTEGNWQEAWEGVQRGHAIANGVVVAGVNRVGKEGETNFWGGSFVYSQFGTLITKADDTEGVVIAEINTELGKEVKEGWGLFHNRRPETYQKITEK